jgi:hypothetical protein
MLLESSASIGQKAPQVLDEGSKSKAYIPPSFLRIDIDQQPRASTAELREMESSWQIATDLQSIMVSRIRPSQDMLLDWSDEDRDVDDEDPDENSALKNIAVPRKLEEAITKEELLLKVQTRKNWKPRTENYVVCFSMG